MQAGQAELLLIDAPMTTVLLACVQYGGRSQIAAAWFNAMVDPTKARAISAGTEPVLPCIPK